MLVCVAPVRARPVGAVGACVSAVPPPPSPPPPDPAGEPVGACAGAGPGAGVAGAEAEAPGPSEIVLDEATSAATSVEYAPAVAPKREAGGANARWRWSPALAV